MVRNGWVLFDRDLLDDDDADDDDDDELIANNYDTVIDRCFGAVEDEVYGGRSCVTTNILLSEWPDVAKEFIAKYGEPEEKADGYYSFKQMVSYFDHKRNGHERDSDFC